MGLGVLFVCFKFFLEENKLQSSNGSHIFALVAEISNKYGGLSVLKSLLRTSAFHHKGSDQLSLTVGLTQAQPLALGQY